MVHTHDPNIVKKTPDRPVITNTLNNVYAMRTKSDLIKYLHLACWSRDAPVPTACSPIDNYDPRKMEQRRITLELTMAEN